MKKLLLALTVAFVAFTANSSQAQISINFNVGSQPLWGPVGYDRADYYYLPDIQTYYSVPKRQYVYLNDGRWLFSTNLPSRYSGYNLYNGYKVVMNSPRPYLYFNDHKVKYAKYKGLKAKQKSIKYSNDSKYYIVKGHPKHAKKSYSSNNQVRTIKTSSVKNGNVKAHSNSKKSSDGHGKGKGKKH
ncbi:hypothetical protein [Daejeonella oryzae]|uniref:hypothetical protein n=1 Tax=Daejeonella oryzae TaxID=1122943 RepID=UPI0009DBF72B|nr:hypothetical protein [Daejeonella oryzae]